MRRSAYYALGASWAECWAEVSRGVRKRRLMRTGGKSRRAALRDETRRIVDEEADR